MAKGFKGGKSGGGQPGMMGQLQKLQEQMMQAQDQLAKETVSYTAAGGAIKIDLTGDQKCTALTIDPEFLKDTDAEMLQELLLAALNGALDASRDLALKRLGPLSSGLPF